VVSRPTTVNLADDSAWCLPGAIPGAQLIVEPRLLLWTGGCGACGADIDRLSALVVWHCGTAIQHAGVDRRALCVHWAAATPASQYTFHRNYIRPSVPTQNGRDGLAGREAPNLPSHLAVPIKDVNEKRMSLEIVYAARHV